MPNMSTVLHELLVMDQIIKMQPSDRTILVIDDGHEDSALSADMPSRVARCAHLGLVSHRLGAR